MNSTRVITIAILHEIDPSDYVKYGVWYSTLHLAQHFNGKIQARDEYIKQSFVSKKQKFQTNFKIISCNLIEARFHRNDI